MVCSLVKTSRQIMWTVLTFGLVGPDFETCWTWLVGSDWLTVHLCCTASPEGHRFFEAMEDHVIIWSCVSSGEVKTWQSHWMFTLKLVSYWLKPRPLCLMIGWLSACVFYCLYCVSGGPDHGGAVWRWQWCEWVSENTTWRTSVGLDPVCKVQWKHEENLLKVLQ